MAEQRIEHIKDYDVLFAVRTGVTVLVPKTAIFDCGVEMPAFFHISPESPRDLVIGAAGKTALIRDMKKDYIDEAVARGFIMFYEMEEEEVIRCTPCSFKKL